MSDEIPYGTIIVSLLVIGLLFYFLASSPTAIKERSRVKSLLDNRTHNAKNIPYLKLNSKILKDCCLLFEKKANTKNCDMLMTEAYNILGEAPCPLL